LLVAQPANPTGNLYADGWLEAACARPILVCVDETYVDFAGRRSLRHRFADRPNVVTFVSFSKLLGLAGLRLGALIGRPERLAELRERDRFYRVDAISLYALLGGLADRAAVAATIEHVRYWRPILADLLRSYPNVFARVVTTEANFCLAQCAPM